MHTFEVELLYLDTVEQSKIHSFSVAPVLLKIYVFLHSVHLVIVHF